MVHRVTLIEGDGIGKEVTQAAAQIIEASGVRIKWDFQEAGLGALQKYGSSLPEKTLDSIRHNGVALKGPTTTPIGTGHRSANVELRQKLDLYACIRPIKSIPGVNARYDNVDLVVVRENTEGLYSGKEIEVVEGVVTSLKVVTEKASKRIAKKCFQYARNHGRKRVTAVHKANILKKGDGLFLSCAQKMALEFPNIPMDDKIIDALCMQLVLDPSEFDMLLLPNLYGDIVSDLCAGLVGGLGLAPGANIGTDAAVFEAIHGSAPDIAGRNIANPTAIIKSGCLMLEHMGEYSAAKRIESGLHRVLADGRVLTGDLGGHASTDQFSSAVISAL